MPPTPPASVAEEPEEPGDPYERDTQAPEEEDLMALLLPDGQLPRCHSGFGLQYNAALLAGWVKQRSPACAAASLAGSWNALLGLGRTADGALDQDDLLVVMRHNLQRTIDRRRDKLDRLLGARFAPIDAALRARVAREGRSFGGKAKSGDGVPPALCIRLLREVVAEALAGGALQAPLADILPETACNINSGDADAACGVIQVNVGVRAGAALPPAPAAAAELAAIALATVRAPGIDGRANPGIVEGAAPKIAGGTAEAMCKASLPKGAGFTAGTNASTPLVHEKVRDARLNIGAALGLDAGAAWPQRDAGAASGCDWVQPPTAFLFLDAAMRSDDAARADATDAGRTRACADEGGDGSWGGGWDGGTGSASAGGGPRGDGGESGGGGLSGGGERLAVGDAAVPGEDRNLGHDADTFSVETGDEPPAPLRSLRAGGAGRGGGGAVAQPSRWNWREDVTAYYAAVGGMERLQRPKPSTGYFGNGDVAAAMVALSESRGAGRCRVLPLAGRALGKGAASVDGYIRVSQADGEAEVARQWRDLQDGIPPSPPRPPTGSRALAPPLGALLDARTRAHLPPHKPLRAHLRPARAGRPPRDVDRKKGPEAVGLARLGRGAAHSASVGGLQDSVCRVRALVSDAGSALGIDA
eukprot:scaffold462_cov89-Isochrysis_galbana.AAC.1